ncbi:MAG: leucine-rich repeat domain-containing protein [Anaeroplasmataceae bacterium]|nr:leucine-rich repeat domain-containing protein [Anaeroplasmataceae bacterium]
MKKRIIFIAVLSLALCFFFSCKEKDTPNEDDNPPVVNPPGTEHTHTWGNWQESKKATCTEAGEKTRKCNSCNQAETEVIPALNHNFKDGYCTRCTEIDPTNTEMVDGREFVSVIVSNSGVLSFSRLKCASKYVLTISNASEEKRTIELDKTQGSYSLESLPAGRTMVTLTAYEKLEIKVENETHYQDVPISTATDEFRITKVNNTYTLQRLKYTDEYITLEGFYDEPRTDSQTKEAYYLYETIYKAPSLSSIMNNSHIKNDKNFKLKDSSKYKLVYYESNGTTSFTLGANHYMNVERASYMKYYIAVVEKDTEIEVKRYPIKTYGLTTAEIEFKQLTITEENGIRQVETKDLLNSPISMTEGDILPNQQIYTSSIEEGLLARTSLYSVIERDEDLVVPASNASSKVILYFYEEELVREDCQEYENISKEFNLTESEYGWTLRAITQEKNVTIPAYIVGKPVVSASFYNSPLETLTLSEGITMWIVSLNDCANIEKIVLPSTITYMGYQSFNGVRRGCEIYCNFSKSKGDSFVTNWNQIAGSFYTYDTYYIDTPIIKDGCQVQILDGKGVITGYTDEFMGTFPESVSFGLKEYPIFEIRFFGFSDFESLHIPDGIKIIGDNAFADYNNLVNITIPNSITNIGNNAFAGCSSLTNVYFEGSIEDWCQIQFSTLDSNPMAYASHFYLKNTNNQWQELTHIEIPDTISEIGSYQFNGFNNVLSIEISNSVTNIGSSAFLNCNKLIEIYNFSDLNITIGSANYGYIGYYAKAIHTVPEESNLVEKDDFLFIKGNDNVYSLIAYMGKNTEIVFPNDINGNTYVIQSSIFENDENLTSVTLSTGVTGIGVSAFKNCENLTTVVIPSSTTTIDSSVFSGCNNINMLSIPISLSSYFTKSNLRQIIITEAESIKANAFSNCTNLKNIMIPSGVKTIESKAFYNCKQLTNVYFEGSIEDWCQIQFSTLESNPMYYASHFYLRNSIHNWEEIKSIEIPDTITKIGNYQFYGFSYLTSVKFSDQLESIGNNAFANCSNIGSVILPNVSSVGNNAFENCRSLEILEIPKVTALGEAAFSNCGNLIKISVSANYLASIEKSKLEEVIITSGEIIERDAFKDCTNLTNITLASSITTINQSFLQHSIHLYYEGSIESWCNINIPDGLTGYPIQFYLRNANLEWEEVTNLEIPDSITKIGSYQFVNFIYITSVELSNHLEIIGYNAFTGCAISSLIIPKGVTTLNESFSYCKNLETIILPKSIKEVVAAFDGCPNSKKIYYEGTAEDWKKVTITSNSSSDRYTVYYYSEDKPVLHGNYWHYVDGVLKEWE